MPVFILPAKEKRSKLRTTQQLDLRSCRWRWENWDRSSSHWWHVGCPLFDINQPVV